jgi:isoleucyl-tRNA synthetase
MDSDKQAAYQTLYRCLVEVSRLGAPLAPFYMERLYLDMVQGSGHGAWSMEHGEAGAKKNGVSVHLDSFPVWDNTLIDKELEARMDIAQKVSSMILALRKKVNIKVRQPLARIMVPVLDHSFRAQFEAVRNLILTEVNVKEVEYIDGTAGILVKKIKPDFRALGPRFGKAMKEVAAAMAAMSQDDIMLFEQEGGFELTAAGQKYRLELTDVEIISEDIPGWLVANEGRLTVALDITVTEELRNEGIAREFINRIQNLRKESGFEVTDKITVLIEDHDMIREAVTTHAAYIGAQTLAIEVRVEADLNGSKAREIEIDDLPVRVVIRKA